MTVLDMATIITTELGVYDDTSVFLAKFYIGEAYTTIWNKYPWDDTQMRVETTIPGGAPILQLTPPDPDIPLDDAAAKLGSIDAVIAIRARNIISGDVDTVSFRADARMLEPVTSKFLIESAPEMFEQGGYVKYYEEWTDTVTGANSIRFYPTPVTGVSLSILAKAKRPVITDTSESIIRNIDPALIAYATAAMLRRQRQYAKADLKYKEAQQLETDAWNLEQQQANLPRMTKATTVAGNSLSEMIDAVCTICGQWTPDYRLIIREFLRRNYQSAYDTFLWPESLVMVRVPYTTEQVILPEYIDRVIGVRGSDNMRMFPADAGLILDISPSSFDEIGQPVSYTTLTPVGVATLPATLTKLVLASTSSVDTSMVALRGEVLSTGTQLEEQIQLDGTNPVTSFYSYDIPLTVAKDITVGYVTVNALNDGNRLLVQLLPYQRETKHQRLWFLPAPTPLDVSVVTNGHTSDAPTPGGIPQNDPAVSGFYVCLVLGKRAIRPLLTDQDTPIITGVQQVLIAAAAGDLFRKLEKHDLANAMLQKASGAMDVLKAKNTDQAASAPRFVPQCEPRAYVMDYGSCQW